MEDIRIRTDEEETREEQESEWSFSAEDELPFEIPRD
jgi:hypothetical protein